MLSRRGQRRMDSRLRGNDVRSAAKHSNGACVSWTRGRHSCPPCGLVHRAGYVMKKAGVANMFPHTSHVESIGVFERADA